MVNSSRVAKNVVSGFATKIIILILGIIIPRIILVSFGSEINGFLSTITQIFTYFALLEAGIGNSAVNALYTPLAQRDQNLSNKVLRQARNYYRKSTIPYSVLVALLAIIYPLTVTSTIPRRTMLLIIILQGLSHVIPWFFCSYYEMLLTADGKQYVSHNFGFVIHILTSL